MMKRLQLLLLATLVLSAFRVVTQTQTIVVVPADASADFTVSHVIGTYGPTPSSTANATTNYARFDLGSFQAGTSIRVGTCGMAEAVFERNTFLRLFIANTATELASNDDNCFGRGSQINFVVPYDMTLELHAGCYANSIACGGTIAMTTELDATPRPFDVKAAFSRINDQGVLEISPDPSSLIRGINYQGDGWGEKYHHQGIARTYNRARYDLVWTTSVRVDGGPEFNNVFLTKLGTKIVARSQRFGSNAFDVLIQPWPQIYAHDGSPPDAVIAGSNAGVYDAYEPGNPNDWDGVPPSRRLDHAGGIQSIGNYIATSSEFVTLPCTRNQWDPECPEHGDRNIPPSGQSSQVVLYNIAEASPRPQLLIARKGEGSGWAAVAKLREAWTPPALRNGYLVMVPDGDRLSLYAIPPEPCTGYVSLSQIKPYRVLANGQGPVLDPFAPATCPGERTPEQQSVADLRRVLYAGCVKRVDQGDDPESDPTCPNLVSMYEDGQRHDFPHQDDVQSANFVTQADGQLYLLAFEGQRVEWGPNSEVQLWRVVFGVASGAGRTAWLPNGTQCTAFLCLVRAGTEDAHDSYKNMNVDRINGTMFRYGGSGYIVPNRDPKRETFFIYGTEHYLQKTPRAALFNEF
jgi:hypothetical protein